ncbi:hypothetical protein [Niabella ginsengisoli]|uniref:Uncharacterized protein n=1 Tax=Niabella ginsengisoli TaxID=522298 RepID=A0ABS9SPW6_9BACT|nr:hypothetical protein [Niabella ginsengisoli]MCH5600458.1 hypothetical protein [Niabella ginsengisoli]
MLQVNDREDSIAKSNQLALESNGVITANNKNVGYIVSTSKLGENNQTYNVLDINKKQIATLTFNRFDASVDKTGSNSMKTFDNNNFQLQEKYTSKNIQSDKLANRMVKKLFANGYMQNDAKHVAIK